jgi:hypothetical protein
LKYDLSKEDYDTYRGFLLKKIAASKDNTKDELENLKKVKDALKELDSSVNVVGFESEFKFPTEQQEKAFKQIKESFEQRGIVWNASAKAFAVYAVLEMKPGTSFGRELKPVDDKGIKNPLQESAKLTQEEMDDLSTRVGTTQRVFDEFGNSIIDSMFGAKMSIGEVTAELGKMMAKMALMKLMDLGINFLFGLPMGGLNAVAVAGHDVGGVIGYGQKNIIADPRIFYGAERFSEGGILGGIPIIGHKGEIILNERQQNNLIDLISSLTANRLNTTSAVQQVKVTGRLTADRMNFIGEVNSAQADYNNIIQAGGFDRA